MRASMNSAEAERSIALRDVRYEVVETKYPRPHIAPAIAPRGEAMIGKFKEKCKHGDALMGRLRIGE